MTGRPIEMILARNLLASISTPAFLVDRDGALIFYNEAAGALLGRRFEETGKMTAAEWGPQFGPFGLDDEPIEVEEVPVTVALRRGRPTHAHLKLRIASGEIREIEVSALPIVGTEGFRGAMAIFWPVQADEAQR